jgi:hypothetical protein
MINFNYARGNFWSIVLKIVYSSEKLEKICSDPDVTKKYFGGNMELVTSLEYKIYSLKRAPNLKDVINTFSFRFHKLHNIGKKRYEGFYAIDVKTRKEPWRIILQPLDDNMTPFGSHNIDAIASCVKIIEIEEISKHYE